MNQIPIFPPSAGNTLDCVELIKWTKDDEDIVLKGDTIAIIEVNGQRVSLKSPVAGRIAAQHFLEGVMLEPHVQIGIIETRVILADCYTDDRQHEAQFDATDWFEQATDQAIESLVVRQRTEEDDASAVALWFRDRNPKVTAMFEEIERFDSIQDSYQGTLDFECYVSERSLFDWLKINRPRLFNRLTYEDIELSSQTATQSPILAPDVDPLKPIKFVRWKKGFGDIVLKDSTIAIVTVNGLEKTLYSPATGRVEFRYIEMGATLEPKGQMGLIETQVIPAECYTSDQLGDTWFDATEWFEQATDEEIQDLAACNWGGDNPADEIARFFRARNPKVESVFEHLKTANDRRRFYEDETGFECHIDGSSGVNWLKINRPQLFNRLTHEEIIADWSTPIQLDTSEDQAATANAEPQVSTAEADDFDITESYCAEFLNEALRSLFRLSAISSNIQESIAEKKAEILELLQRNPDSLIEGNSYEIEEGSITLQRRRQYQIDPDTVRDLVSSGDLPLNLLVNLAFPNSSVQNASALKTVLGEQRFSQATAERLSEPFLTVKPSKLTKNQVGQETFDSPLSIAAGTLCQTPS